MRISKIEMFHVRPRFSFLKLSTDEGIAGWGEAVVEGRSRTVEMAVKELEPHLIGQDPRRIEHLWQAMYRGTFYRGGPILTSAISGLEQAMWDILGKSLNVPVYQLLGGAVRNRIRMYKGVGGSYAEETYANAKRWREMGFTMMKTGIEAMAHVMETPAWISKQVERIEAIRDAIGNDCDLGIDFHGRISPALAVRLIKELERFQPAFIEEPCLPENVDTMATIARSTTLPIATGERLFTKWAFRNVLEKQAAAILQPDLAHCGGIMEGKKIAAMAEVYFAGFAPHNPLGPINLAASVQLSANVPNFLAQEHASLGEGYLKQPFVVTDGYLEIPTGPGLGIEVDEDALKDKLYAGDWDTPRWFHEDDGSVADW
ncbi:galactonate dehydratase [Paenibacillus endophyticus]|uniref:Galactonate dehydratase n=1 Tax=Paenibacillus endophyticus TaxID=1294268 RepID=A0A7W5C3F9_9BACL|nr:galactonate dehydratase [Paenibacillus endophyticus]MBB3150381.1 galactonate dehydratase [Paenibacillus endophyticus]